MRDRTIEALSDALVGRRVERIERRVYPPSDGYIEPTVADYPVLFLDDGSEVVLLDGWGFPPFVEVEKAPA